MDFGQGLLLGLPQAALNLLQNFFGLFQGSRSIPPGPPVFLGNQDDYSVLGILVWVPGASPVNGIGDFRPLDYNEVRINFHNPSLLVPSQEKTLTQNFYRLFGRFSLKFQEVCGSFAVLVREVSRIPVKIRLCSISWL
jgi:hypothetical protein